MSAERPFLGNGEVAASVRHPTIDDSAIRSARQVIELPFAQYALIEHETGALLHVNGVQ